MVLTVPPRRMAKVGRRVAAVGAHQLGDDRQVGAVAAAGRDQIDAGRRRSGAQRRRARRGVRVTTSSPAPSATRAQPIAEAGRASHAERVGVEDDGELHGSRKSQRRDPLARVQAQPLGREGIGGERGEDRHAPRSRRPRRNQRSAAQSCRLAREARVGQASPSAQPELVGGIGEAAARVQLAAEEIVEQRALRVGVGELLQGHEVERRRRACPAARPGSPAASCAPRLAASGDLALDGHQARRRLVERQRWQGRS